MENINITQHIEWKEGKVKNFFGKELLDLKNGSVKLVKVAPLASYPEHLHPDKTEFAYVVEGNPHFQIGETGYAGNPGEFYVFPVNVLHSITNKSETECILLVGAIKN